MVAYTDGDKSGISLKNERISSTKTHSSKSTSTEISIPDTDSYQTNCKRDKQTSRISRATHHVHSTKNNSFSRFFSVKTVGLILLFCDIVYLNFYLSRTESVLHLTLKRIDKLETELHYSRLTTKILRSDFNFAKEENEKLTYDILTTLSTLIKQKEVSKFDDENIFDNLFVQQNDNTMRQFVHKSAADRNLDGMDNGQLIFNNGDSELPLDHERVETILKGPEFYAHVDLENNKGASEFADVKGFVDRSVDRLNLDESTIFFPNETVQSVDLFAVDDDDDDDDDRATRTRREAPSERRGKHQSHGKQKKRAQHINCNFFCCSSGPLAVILRGVHPEVIIEDGGLIAPWVTDRNGAGDYPFKDFVFREGNGKIEISGKGLYLIYAQVFYLSANHLNGFSINMQKSGAQAESEIARCSNDITTKRTSEVSCYTSVIRQLLPGDKIYLVQRERNSRILHGDGYTYFGIVALNSPPKC
ncbi:uncharacterized protein LOC111059004 isoform X2 [Nilaparvata lugens]|uniref:uncharacterized protein LOC111059004 isoform X2 n=1 Tax=Nilaparvata lugens TaxID=108931 RepID=UPI00193DD3F8|nr:uncharacterized protein LOC111059004 isoform X2 [Nilaparvata lugens]